MVRFSDMLGGEGEPDDARAATAARDLTPLVDDEPPDPDAPVDEAPSTTKADAEPAPGGPSPQDVLDRLTHYATATRAAARQPEPEPEPPEPEPEPPAAAAIEPTTPPAAASPPAQNDSGDDLLPRAKRSLRKRRDS